ncbi:peptidoglycan-binding protein [Streptomyces sp. NPDC050560]|uniref:peptidoglycan-binding protein n=1 Tax=Streptomyces sp. NPDC050560 TaxID=3365630 RepID=UPI00378B55D5
MRATPGRWALPGAAVLAAAVLGVLGTAPAHASVAQGGVYGTGVVTDDWGDEGPLSTTQNSHNNVVALWQTVLWADGLLPDSGRDCEFGPQTADATKAWQRAHGLTADGVVGPATFGKADDSLSLAGDEIRYTGSQAVVTGMYRDSTGRYYSTYEGTTYYLSYTVADGPVCD